LVGGDGNIEMLDQLHEEGPLGLVVQIGLLDGAAVQQFPALYAQRSGGKGHPRDVAARPVEPGDEAKLDRVGAYRKSDRNRCGSGLDRERRRDTTGSYPWTPSARSPRRGPHLPRPGSKAANAIQKIQTKRQAPS